MGYAHGRRWTTPEVLDSIMKMINETGIERMPSRAEIDRYYGDSSLSNKISKTGGFYKYAEMLELPVKKCETELGRSTEKFIRQKMIELGFDAELTGTKSPYDLLVNRRVKLDVKASRIVTSGASPYYTFNLEKKDPSCDFYVAITLDAVDQVKEIYVIPSSLLAGKCQLSIGMGNSIYRKYINRWELIEKLDEAFKSIESA